MLPNDELHLIHEVEEGNERRDRNNAFRNIKTLFRNRKTMFRNRKTLFRVSWYTPD